MKLCFVAAFNQGSLSTFSAPLGRMCATSPVLQGGSDHTVPNISLVLCKGSRSAAQKGAVVRLLLVVVSTELLVQWRGTKMVRVLEHVSCKERMMDLSSFRLVKRRLWRRSTNTYRDIIQKTEPGSLQQCVVGGEAHRSIGRTTGIG